MRDISNQLTKSACLNLVTDHIKFTEVGILN